MSKKKAGLLVALGAIAGAAAGLSYYLKYKSFNKDVENDFHEYEDDDIEDDSDVSSCDSTNRTYITLNKSCECTEACESKETCKSEEICECEKSCDAAETCESCESADVGECNNVCECKEEVCEEQAETCATATVKEETEGAAE